MSSGGRGWHCVKKHLKRREKQWGRCRRFSVFQRGKFSQFTPLFMLHRSASHFIMDLRLKIIYFLVKKKQGYLNPFWSGKGLKDRIVNWTCNSFLTGDWRVGSPKCLSTLPLILIFLRYTWSIVWGGGRGD